MTDTSERALIERCRQGDDEAFRTLVDRYKGLVFALVARTVIDRARADELSQEVFLRVYRGLPHFRGEARLSTWIYRIVANVVSQERRAAGVRPVSLDEVDPIDHRPVRDPGVADRAYNQIELRDRLEKAIARLPEAYQLLVNGHYLEGMQYDELATALNLPMGTVKTHLHRAKRQLRVLLETELG